MLFVYQYLYGATYILSSWSAVIFLTSVWGAALTDTLGVFEVVARPVRLTVLAGCGAVCDITGAPLLLSCVSGRGTFAEVCPFLICVSLCVLVFPLRSATAACVTWRLTTLEAVSLVVASKVVQLGALLVFPFFSPPHSDLCFVTLSVGSAAALFIFDIPTLLSSFTEATVHFEVGTDFSPRLGTWQDVWECFPGSGFELDVFWFWTLTPLLAVKGRGLLTGLFRAVLREVFVWAMADFWETEIVDDMPGRTLTEVVGIWTVRAGTDRKCDCVLLGCTTAGMSPVFVLTTGPRLNLVPTDFVEPSKADFESLLNFVIVNVFEEAWLKDCILVFGCFFGAVTAGRLDLEEAAVFMCVSTGIRLGSDFGRSPMEDGYLAFCCPVWMLPLTFTLSETPKALLGGHFVAWAAEVFTLVPSGLKVSAGNLFSFPLTIWGEKKEKKSQKIYIISNELQDIKSDWYVATQPPDGTLFINPFHMTQFLRCGNTFDGI